jgi:hypothetical protein
MSYPFAIIPAHGGDVACDLIGLSDADKKVHNTMPCNEGWRSSTWGMMMRVKVAPADVPETLKKVEGDENDPK